MRMKFGSMAWSNVPHEKTEYIEAWALGISERIFRERRYIHTPNVWGKFRPSWHRTCETRRRAPAGWGEKPGLFRDLGRGTLLSRAVRQ